ncbi:DNA/RNA non-specific endonuclease, partial [Geitlerinema sp. CS-897]|nr:DNA/RNA non-specific endonuclease [Geitlerinema sp. CS-897]
NEAVEVVVVPYEDTHYAFVAGHNYRALGLGLPGWNGKGNIGIIKDALSDNPQLVAGTRSLPEARVNGVALSGDGKALYAAYPGLESTFVFEVEQMLATASNPSHWEDLRSQPIEEINPNIFLAGRLRTIENPATGEQRYEVDPDDPLAPISTEGEDYSVTVASTPAWDISLNPPTTTWSEDALTPTLTWEFDDLDSGSVEQVNLYLSTFDEGEGLLPGDRWFDVEEVGGEAFQQLSSSEKEELLGRWNDDLGLYDFNPNRILTATWNRYYDANSPSGDGDGEWQWGNGIRFTDGPNTRFTLPEELTLTAGQEYNWAVEAFSNGQRQFQVGEFWTPVPPAQNGDNTFSGVTVLTHGFQLPQTTNSQSQLPERYYQLGHSIAQGSPDREGLVMDYDSNTGYWVPVDKNGRREPELSSRLGNPDYLTQLGNYIQEEGYLQDNEPLVLLPNWLTSEQSAVPDAGFTEAAADSLFSSLVQLDNLLKPNSDAEQGALFDSPLHLIGFSRGTVVNSEIVQRLGTYFPNAGGKIGSSVRDLQMTTLDPHDFNQPSLELLGFDFSDFREPKVQVWENVTFADNYYQTVPELEGMTFTPGGRDLPRLPTTETIDLAGLKFLRQGWANRNPDPNAPLLGEPDVSIQLGTRQGEEGYEDGRAGFTRETDPLFGFGGTHTRVPNWYAGTADLFPTHFPFDSESDEGALFRRRGDGYYDHLYDEAFPRVSPWYSPDHLGSEFAHGEESAPWEGIGTGWFYSVLGGGAALNLRPSSDVERVPVAFDNTYDAPMRGDFAVPTLFNGNFDAVFQPKDGFRNLISDAVPGWSFHNGEDAVSTSQLVDLKDVGTLEEHLRKVGNDPSSDGYQTDYALKLGDGDKITHNRFVVPDWGVLRFDLHVPEPQDGLLKVSIKGTESDDEWISAGEIDLKLAENPAESESAVGYYDYVNGEYIDPYTYSLDYALQGLETFHLDIPENLRGKSAVLQFTLEGDSTVYLDDVFFKSAHLKLGNPTLARPFENTHRENYLIEKPQYSLSYNDAIKGPNWVSWQVNKSWIGSIKRPNKDEAKDIGYPPTNFPPNSIYSADLFDYPWLSDSSLPTNWVKTASPDYRASFGLDKGHMIPSENRREPRKIHYLSSK